ncbi:MAG: hypothetical protein M1482_08620 [Chloroflexi bacterium]|nr:hypothetical protein [Chloroflexota bacterium]
MNHERGRGPGFLLGIFLIGLGVLFLVGQFVRVDAWHYLWPLFILGFALFFFAGMIAGGRGSESGFFAIPGTLFAMLSLIFLYQVLSDHWASWAYAWLLLAPTSIGIGLMISAWWSRHPGLWPVGVAMAGIGLVAFVGVGGFFELILGLAGIETPARILWPVMLILLGLVILFGRGMRWLAYPGAGFASATAGPSAGAGSSAPITATASVVIGPAAAPSQPAPSAPSATPIEGADDVKA